MGDSAAVPCSPNCSHRGHRRYVGGPRDGHVDRLIHAAPSDYPQTMGSALIGGSRTWYVLDYDASEGVEAVYRFIGWGREFPQRPIDTGDANG
jgi:hypothetical protein